MELEKVKGIVIDADGQEHPFGIYNKEKDTEHDKVFKKEIVMSPWFQAQNYPYDPRKTIYEQIMDMTNYGLTFLLNGSSKIQNGGEYKLYTIQCPLSLSEKTKEYFRENYCYLKELTKEEGVWFQGEPYNNGEYVWPDAAYQLDDFYDKMALEKGKLRKH